VRREGEVERPLLRAAVQSTELFLWLRLLVFAAGTPSLLHRSFLKLDSKREGAMF
jgi:hypothetical protein